VILLIFKFDSKHCKRGKRLSIIKFNKLILIKNFKIEYNIKYKLFPQDTIVLNILNKYC